MKKRFPESIPSVKKIKNLKSEGTRLLVVAITAAVSGAIGSHLYEIFHSEDNSEPADCSLILTVDKEDKKPVVDPRLQNVINEYLKEENRDLLYYPEDESNCINQGNGETRL